MNAAQLEFANQRSCSAQLTLAAKHPNAFSSDNTDLHALRNSKLPAFSIHGRKCHSISKRSLWKGFQEQSENATSRKSGLSSRAAGVSCCSNEHQITKEDGSPTLSLVTRFLKLFSRRKDPITRESSIVKVSLLTAIYMGLSCFWIYEVMPIIFLFDDPPQDTPMFLLLCWGAFL
jgi:hypothetical protein